MGSGLQYCMCFIVQVLVLLLDDYFRSFAGFASMRWSFLQYSHTYQLVPILYGVTITF